MNLPQTKTIRDYREREYLVCGDNTQHWCSGEIGEGFGRRVNSDGKRRKGTIAFTLHHGGPQHVRKNPIVLFTLR